MENNTVLLDVNWDRVTSLDEMKELFKILISQGGHMPSSPEKAEKLIKTGYFKKVS